MGPRARDPRAARGSGAGGDSGTEDRGPRRWLSIFARRWLWVLIGLLVLNWLITPYLLPEPAQERITVPYTTFKEQVSAGNVSEITSRGDLIQGTFKQPVTYPLGAGRAHLPPVRDPRAHLRQRRPGGPAGIERGADLRPPDPVRALRPASILLFGSGPALLRAP